MLKMNYNNYNKKFALILSIIITIVIIKLVKVYLSNLIKLELVISYYNENIEDFARYLKTLKKLNKKFHLTKTIYVKNSKLPQDTLTFFHNNFDSVIHLDNIGREGGTFLYHIISRYKATLFPDNMDSVQDVLPHLTMFLQPHQAWNWILEPRLDYINKHTGFLSLGPYVAGNCGTTVGHYLPQMNTIFKLFNGYECPQDESQLVTWAGQFIVSHDRILSNPISTYVEMYNLLTVSDVL